MAEFEGRTVIVTGGASGMGEAVARDLAAKGAHVAILDIREASARRVVKSFPGSSERHLALQVDVTSPDAVARAVEDVVDRFGGVDLLCNSAGIPDDATVCHDMSLEQWYQVLAVDLTGPFLLARAVLPTMVAQGRGAIVNIASMAGVVASGGGVAYTAAKHGLVGLTKRLAVEYGPLGIHVNAVCPGYIRTPMNLPYRDMLMDTVAATPAGRWAEPEEVAALVAHLFSDQARYIMGATIMIDGGSTVV